MTSISGIILAGGQGRRMGSVDKGLQHLRGKPLIEWVIERFAPQLAELMINANRNIEQYIGYGYRVISDDIKDFAGPLAGFHAGLMAAKYPYVATVPCDSPFLPTTLVSRLLDQLQVHNAQIAVAKTGNQAHPVFSLCKQELASHLGRFLESGGRKIDLWYSTLKIVEVNFDDEVAAFDNINTLQELATYQSSN